MEAETESQTVRRKVSNKWVFLSLLSVGSCLSIAICIAILHCSRSTTFLETDGSENAAALSDSYVHACDKTRYPELCIFAFTSKDNRQQVNVKEKTLDSLADAEGLAIAAMKIALKYQNAFLNQTVVLQSETRNEATARTEYKRIEAALADCVSLMEDARDLIADAIKELGKHKSNYTEKIVSNVETWISAAMTDHITCEDGISSDSTSNNRLAEALKQKGERVQKLLSISLSFLPSHDNIWKHTTNQRADSKLILPMWMKESDHAILQDPSSFINVTVAADRSGQFLTVQDAVNAAPLKSSKRFVIYIKKGTYNELVLVPKGATNIMLIGDGINQTIIKGDRNVQDGSTTFNSATVAAVGNGFLAQDITFQNTAGALKQQAVALRVDSDQSAFYRCSFEGYQDTLYTHTLRQFYRDCVILGTVDFIFGNAAAVFQNCTLLARVPLEQQKITFTAQGRTDPNQNTGLSFQTCTVDGVPDLKAVIENFPTYLGRPWKLYSRTVFLRSYEGGIINAAGWLEWNGSFALDTLFYGEYLCEGPGFGASQRVSWSTQITNSSFANQFAVDSFISGKDWLPATGFPFEDSVNGTEFSSGLRPVHYEYHIDAEYKTSERPDLSNPPSRGNHNSWSNHCVNVHLTFDNSIAIPVCSEHESLQVQ
ncbi:hypothetical protein O6H91_11G065300 [Diphasiastrum complanatum]|uniref:Uncharacterized protein n=1 Tax=Diphasiastrum complanatum TaxID=34168 RepID=A0ACC2CA01_DIPCM|nr:hypothetical protein O6H91_11G065300 [Diphasiastrum complanatum]